METGIAFLGFSERAAYVRDGNTNLYKWNILGLKQHLISYIYPFNLNGWSVTFAIHSSYVGDDINVVILDEEGKEAAYINLTLGKFVESGVTSPPDDGGGKYVLIPKDGWNVFSAPLINTSLVIFKPGAFTLAVKKGGNYSEIGKVNFYLIEPPPLTTDRIAAIRSDPTATKSVRIVYTCKECNDQLIAYASLDRSAKQEDEGAVWYSEISDSFNCRCGKTNVDTTYVKRKLYDLLGVISSDNKEIGNVPLYERSSLEDILDRFNNLIKTNPKEEAIQKLIENNLIILHQFPAQRILFKPPILNKYIADFGILTAQKELILIEIEKSSTRLLKKDGHMASQLSHAFDQVTDWLHCIDEHRQAILDDLDIEKNSVSTVKGVVIAGTDSGYDAAHLRKLKGIDRGRVSFLTYDDLAFALKYLIKNIHAT